MKTKILVHVHENSAARVYVNKNMLAQQAI